MRTTYLMFAAVALAACQKAETPEQASARMTTETAAARTAIDAGNARYAGGLNNHNADSVASVYMDGGVMMPPNAKIVVGKDSIRAAMTAMPLPTGARITLHTVDVVANGPIAIERGTYTFEMPAVGRTPAVSVPGHYLAHWHKMGNEWLIAADLWSDDVAMPSMPMPPAANH